MTTNHPTTMNITIGTSFRGRGGKCKHTKVGIWTQYFRDKPAKIVRAYCPDCDSAMPEIKKLYQDREYKIWEAYGNKSPVVIGDRKIKTVIEQKWEANP